MRIVRYNKSSNVKSNNNRRIEMKQKLKLENEKKYTIQNIVIQGFTSMLTFFLAKLLQYN